MTGMLYELIAVLGRSLWWRISDRHTKHDIYRHIHFYPRLFLYTKDQKLNHVQIMYLAQVMEPYPNIKRTSQ